jgi:hypothetical protein
VASSCEHSDEPSGFWRFLVGWLVSYLVRNTKEIYLRIHTCDICTLEYLYQ